MYKDAEKEEMATQIFDMVSSKILNFHSIRFVMIANLKQKAVKTMKHANTKWALVNMTTPMPRAMYRIKQLVESLQKNTGCWRQAFILPHLDFIRSEGKLKYCALYWF